ncbi:hypothetical protein E3P99_02814 [Wallemia hederae]|uniref:Store-operated calcium entry-associated regulatory factor n=1 Tax=Wallemia hederae TaxID=1540922 RepID=A0A4T0FJ54_9BASI|nr:hypothetical protein E3P99_02814 [Wallemia hederae]
MSKVHLSEISSLNFEADEMTTGRRVPPVPQLQCVEGGHKGGDRDTCGQYTPESVHCENKGWDAYSRSVQWSCTTALPSNLKLGKVRVNCERWSEHGPSDEVLSGSCALKYSLIDTASHPDSGNGTASTFFGVIFFAILAIILYNLFCGRRGAQTGYYGDDGNAPPPPYTPHNKQPQQQQPWRPGFWTGLGVGGAGAHLYDQWQRRDSHSHFDDHDSFGRHNSPAPVGPSHTYESTTSYGGTDTR